MEVGKIPDGISELPIALLLGAIAFAGAGGVMNLVQSNWVRDKGLGMGAKLPKVVSPFTGEETAAPTTGYFFRRDEANMRRWNEWWRVCEPRAVRHLLRDRRDRAAHVHDADLRHGRDRRHGGEADFDFIKLQGDALQADQGDWLGTAFWLIGSVVLFSTNLTVLDMVGRLTADVLKTGALRDSTALEREQALLHHRLDDDRRSARRSCSPGVDQPLVLLVIAAALNGVVMFIYSILLLKLNRGVLPREIGLKGGRLVVIVWARPVLRRLLGGPALRPGEDR